MGKNDIIKSYQIPSRIAMGIFNLPCVYCVKKICGEPVYELTDYYDEDSNHHYVYNIDGEESYHAQPGDWLCELDNGNWVVPTNKEYNELVNKD